MLEIIHNQDPNNLHFNTREPLEIRHIEKMIEDIAASNVNTVLICSNAEVANHPSAVFGSYDEMFEEGLPLIAPNGIPQSFYDIFANDYRQYQHLREYNCDYLDTALQFCRKYKLRPGISVRMNDMHGGEFLDAPCHSRFFRQNPQYRLTVDQHTLGLNYAMKPVRDRILSYIDELQTRYDFELIELDFLRFFHYFHPGTGYENRHLLTGLMREIRQILKGKEIICRIPQSPEGALALGLDIESWSKNQLLDTLAISSFFSLRFDLPISRYRLLIGANIRLIASFDDTDGQNQTFLDNPMLARGGIGYSLAQGTDGIEFFNQFLTTDQPSSKIEKRRMLIHELRSLFTGEKKKYCLPVKPKCFIPETDLPFDLPCEIKGEFQKDIWLLPSSKAKLKIVLIKKESKDIKLKVNGISVEYSTCSKVDDSIVIFYFFDSLLKEGINTISLSTTAEIVLSVWELEYV